MTIYLILYTLLQQYKCIADCGDTSTSGDHQLNPQFFLPNSGGDSGGNQNCGPPTGSGYQNYNSGQQSGTSGQPSTGYQPNQAYSQPVAYGVLPQQYQSGNGGGGGNGGNGNGGRRGPLVCDNTAEREAFKKCVSDALRSLKNILENCKRELGENAQECNLSDDCLAKLTGKDKGNCNVGGNGSGGSSGNRNNSYGECSDDDDDSYSSRRPRKRNRRSRNNDSYGSTDSLEEFIKYLESRLCEKDGDNGGRKSSSRRKKSRRSYRDEDSIDDTRSRRRRSQKSRRRKSKKKDSCSDVCEENM